MNSSSISLTVIAKNEATRIAAFIAHHLPLVREIIVVDTGSTDGTASIARTAGAKVFFFEWCDDFSAARNESLRLATSRYALCIDVDERISHSSFKALKKAAQHHRRCYTMPQRNYYSNPQHVQWMPVPGEFPTEERGQIGYFEAQNTKFFDLHCGLKFEQRIHESVLASAKRNHIDISPLNVPIHHYGYVISEKHNRSRNLRYTRLLELKYQEHPDDPQTIEEYATQLIQLGRALDAIPHLEKLDAMNQRASCITRARILLGNLKKGQGNTESADAIFRRAVTEDPGALFAHVQLLKHLAEEMQIDEMGALLDTALERFGEHPLLLKAQSRYLIDTRQIHAAATVTRRVANLFPHQPEYAQLAEKCEALSLKVKRMETKKNDKEA
ncbi:MAG: glycosyltransferase [Deltaproteobacteria bacterium]|nr:glycosyltransferase [Deltaproteobacteria bacterium]